MIDKKIYYNFISEIKNIKFFFLLNICIDQSKWFVIKFRLGDVIDRVKCIDKDMLKCIYFNVIFKIYQIEKNFKYLFYFYQ